MDTRRLLRARRRHGIQQVEDLSTVEMNTYVDEMATWDNLVQRCRHRLRWGRSKNWCFDYVLRPHETPEDIWPDLRNMYLKNSPLIQYMIYQFYTLLNGTQKVSGFIRLEKPRHGRSVWGLFWDAGWMWETVKEIRFPGRRARQIVQHIIAEDHDLHVYIEEPAYEAGHF